MDTEELKRLEGLADIWTAYGETDKDKDEFNLRKKAIRRRIVSSKQRGRWIELVSGEWSETIYNQGNIKFLISHSDDKKAWALLSATFPSRIIAVAESSFPMAEDLLEATKPVRKKHGICEEMLTKRVEDRMSALKSGLILEE